MHSMICLYNVVTSVTIVSTTVDTCSIII